MVASESKRLGFKFWLSPFLAEPSQSFRFNCKILLSHKISMDIRKKNTWLVLSTAASTEVVKTTKLSLPFLHEQVGILK